jgi:HEPN domain-containing protein
MSDKTKGLKGIEEWFLQADYDFETAEVLFNAGRYIIEEQFLRDIRKLYESFIKHILL